MARLKLFANLRELAGTGEVELDAGTVSDVLRLAGERFGADFAEALGPAAVAVNGVDLSALDGPQTVVGRDDEVALLPPVSGGAPGRPIVPVVAALPRSVRDVLFWGTLVAASWFDVRALTVLVVVSAVLSAMAVPRTVAVPEGVLAITLAACAVFPLAALWAGEAGLFWACAAFVAGLSVVFMLRPGRPNLVASAAQEVLLTVYFGFLASYIVILRQDSPGPGPLTALVAMVAVFTLVSAFTASRFGFREAGLSQFFSPSSLAGVAACEVTALALGRLLLDFLSPVATAILGIVVGVCILIGTAAAGVMPDGGADAGDDPETRRSRVPATRRLASPPPSGLLRPFLLAAPAMYHAMRFYLT